MDSPSAADFAREYLGRGWALVMLPSGSKKPVTHGWQNERATAEDFEAEAAAGRSRNMGVHCGSPSANLSRVDLDHPAAVRAAPLALPPTGVVLGRDGNPRSGYFYIVEGGLAGSMTFKDPTSTGDEATILDVLWTGKMTVVPPSVHPSGGTYKWHEFRTAAVVQADVFEQTLREFAAGVVLGIHWPDGARHDAAMALAGGLLTDGWTPEQTEHLFRIVLTAAGDEEVEDRLRAIQDTMDSMATGRNTVGWKRLADMVDSRVLRKVREWLGLAKMAAQARVTSATDLRTTDMGNAQRMVKAFSGELRYCHPMKKWFSWTGVKWQEDSSAIVGRRALDTVGLIYREAADADTKDKRAVLGEWALESESASKIGAMIHLARYHQEITVQPEDMDTSQWLLNTPSGTIDLTTSKLTPHDSGDLITKVTGVAWEEEAECPQWMAFLDLIFQGDDEIIEFVQRAVGYCLTGTTREQCIFLCWGDGANGKSTFLYVLERLLNDYSANTPFDTFDATKHSATGNELARLKGKRLVTAVESEQEKALAEARVKSVTGGDKITCRFLYGEFFEYYPEYKIWLAVNYKPIIRGTDHGMWRRILLLPFVYKFEGVGDIKGYRETLWAAEGPGIFAWGMRGLTKYLDVGLNAPEKILRATSDYKVEMDVTAQFLAEHTEDEEGAEATTRELYARYTFWAKDYGERQLSHRSFGLELARRGYTKVKANSQIKWRGLKLRPETFNPAGMQPHDLGRDN